MRIIFFGSDDFAVTNFEALVSSTHQVVGCVTQPDRAKGRHLKLTPSPVKEFAQQNNIPVVQPVDLKDRAFVQQLKDWDADIFVVIAYGRILPSEILALPRIFCINVHGSLLPKYRGSAPINWAIMNGDTETGVTVIKMNPAMDAGDIISYLKTVIAPEDNAVTLRARMADLSAQLLLQTLNDIEQKRYQLTKQDENAVTVAPKLTKELGAIDWNKSAEEIHNLVRGLLPWPCAFTVCNGKTVKILETKVVASAGTPGKILEVSQEGLTVGTGKGSLLIRQVHPESSKAMSGASFAAGYKVALNSFLQPLS